MAKLKEAPSQDARGEGGAARTMTLVVVVFLCLCSCGLFLMLDPRSLDVGSVYQGF